MSLYTNRNRSGLRTLPSFENAASGGGLARFVDNRAETISQRALQESMQGGDHVQRRVNHRFEGVKESVGKKYNVDLSSLTPVFNSSFPARVGAVATIRDNQVDFAPGHDTLDNMQHEVKHRADNILNGTPKGDLNVNGFNVDTTRESIVDRM